MNRPGKVNDNAYIESFFHSMKSEIVHGLTFTEDHEIEQAVRAYVPFYNDTRLHSSLNYVPPATFETAGMKTRCQQNRGKIPAASGLRLNKDVGRLAAVARA